MSPMSPNDGPCFLFSCSVTSVGSFALQGHLLVASQLLCLQRLACSPRRREKGALWGGTPLCWGPVPPASSPCHWLEPYHVATSSS